MVPQRRYRIVARDWCLSNPTIPWYQFIAFMRRCHVFWHDWGVIMAEGNDVHLHVMSDYRKRVFMRKPLREAARYLFDKYEVIKTSVYMNTPEVLDFDLRMGWKLVGDDGTFYKLEMTKEDFMFKETK